MKTKIDVTKKVGISSPRVYEVDCKDDKLQVYIASKIRAKGASPFVGMIDYEDNKIIFEIATDIPTCSFDFFDIMNDVGEMVSAALSSDAAYFKKYPDYAKLPIEVYFVGESGDYIGSVNYGTPNGRIDESLYDISVSNTTVAEKVETAE